MSGVEDSRLHERFNRFLWNVRFAFYFWETFHNTYANKGVGENIYQAVKVLPSK